MDSWAGLCKVAVGDHAEGELLEHEFGGVYAAQLSRIGPTEAAIWNDPNKRGSGALPVAARIVRLPEGALTKCKSLDELTKLLGNNGFAELAAQLVAGTVCTAVVLFDGKGVAMPMVLGAGQTRKLINYDLVVAEAPGTRLDPEYALLEAAKVAVVGCGSVGSKVAVQLARSGVSRFVLVDGDVLASGNLVRNELDWRAVGMHKSQALAVRLKEVRADCDVTSRTTVMGGQESGDTLSTTMRLIEECDLIIDATADPSVFNLCAAISRRAKKHMCWAQVFGGGAGGVVVRLRPEIDPTPLTARQRLESYYAEQGVDWPDDGSSQPYADTSGPGTPLIADDADVSVIAAHLSRVAIDIIARPDATIFPSSAYLVGMREKWLFTAPFDVRPIDLGEGDAWGTEPQVGDDDALRQLLADLIPGTANAD